MVKPLQPSSSDIEQRRREFQRRVQSRDRILLAIVLLGGLGVALLTFAILGAV